MAAPKRTDYELARDRAEIAHLYLVGIPQAEIAARISRERDYTITQQTVSNDLRAVYKLWRESAIRDFNEDQNRELARIDALELEAWAAWRASKGKKRTVTVERAPVDGRTVTRRQVRGETQTGNPAYLATVQWCIGKRVEILGLAKPIKVAPTTPDGEKPWQDMPDDEKAVRLLQVIRDAQQRSAAAREAGLAQHPN